MHSSGKLFIISCGVGDNSLTPQMLSLIKKADILIGGTRLLEMFNDLPTEKLPIRNNVKEVIQTIQERISSGAITVVLASGDALFHGIGRNIIGTIPEECISIIPNITAFQAGLSILQQPWENGRFFSMHGRTSPLPWRNILNTPLAVIYGDYKNSASHIASYLIKKFPLAKKRSAALVQDLGLPSETIQKGTLEALADISASSLSMLILLNDHETPMPGLPLGRPDYDYKHENNLITHSEVRAVILSKLQLQPGVMWDIGAGSGSVGLEAAMLIPLLTVHAVEKNKKRINLIKENCENHGVSNLTIHHGNALEVINELPLPHTIFIGGGGEDIEALLDICCKKIKYNGRIVVSAVTLETQCRVRQFFQEKIAEHISMSVSRSHQIAKLHMMKPENNIDIFVYHHL